MSQFLYHTNCERCGSKDNKAIYADGSSWCFGCHKWEPPRHREIPTVKATKTPPTDTVKKLPFLYDKWLDKYNLSPKDKSNFTWSPSMKRMVMTIMNQDIGIFWEGRSLTEEPKTLSFGAKPYVIIMNGTCFSKVSHKKLVIVEDFISALKVSHVLPAFPLFGSHLADSLRIRIAKNFQEVSVWLDHDKYPAALELGNQLAHLGLKVNIICTKEDPKCYNNILDILKERGILTA